VAAWLVEVALGAPVAGLVPDLGGLRVRDGRAGPQLPARHSPAPANSVGVAAGQGQPRAYRAGALLAPDRAVGRRTWEEFLAERVSSSSDSRSSLA